LSAKISLTNVIVDCTTAHASGKATNITPGEDMLAHGTEVVVKYSECMARLASKTTAEEQCKVTSIAGEGKITTNPLTAISSVANEHDVTFSPPAGQSIATFSILKEKLNSKACNLPKPKTFRSPERQSERVPQRSTRISPFPVKLAPRRWQFRNLREHTYRL